MAQSFDEWLISRLCAAGAYGGTFDGVPGRRVVEALTRFQRARKLPVTGLADAATIEALRSPPQVSPPTVTPEPVWLREARRFMGLKEISGPQSNTTIMGWAKRFGGWISNTYNNDDVPWCGLFVGNLIATTLPNEILPANPLSALAWAKFGKACNPCLGSILIFKRTGGGHVALYVGEDDDCYHILGGNQSNSVSIVRKPKSQLNACRWPASGGDLTAAVRLKPNGALAGSEA